MKPLPVRASGLGRQIDASVDVDVDKKKRPRALSGLCRSTWPSCLCVAGLRRSVRNRAVRALSARTDRASLIVVRRVRLVGLQRFAGAPVDPLTQFLAGLEVRHVL